MAPGAVARLLMMDGYFYLGAICSALWFVIVGIAGILPLGWWLLGICLLLGFTTAVLLYPIVKHDMAD